MLGVYLKLQVNVLVCREVATKNLGSAVNAADLLAEGKTIMFGDFLKFGVDREDRVYEEVRCCAQLSMRVGLTQALSVEAAAQVQSCLCWQIAERPAPPVQVTDMPKVLKLMEAYLEEYNASSTKAMSLVFFMDAVEHICRISRILRQPRGNAMLVRLLAFSALQKHSNASPVAACSQVCLKPALDPELHTANRCYVAFSAGRRQRQRQAEPDALRHSHGRLQVLPAGAAPRLRHARVQGGPQGLHLGTQRMPLPFFQCMLGREHVLSLLLPMSLLRGSKINMGAQLPSA